MDVNKTKGRIAVISSHTPSLFWFRMDMMESFIKRGYEVFALGNEDEKEWISSFKERGINYRQIEVSRNGTNPIKDLGTIASIKAVLRDIKADKLFLFQAKTIIYGSIAARELGIKEVYSLVAGAGSIFLKDDFKTRLVRRLLVSEYKYSMRDNKVVFFQNEDDRKLFTDCGIVRKQKVTMLPGSGVNCERFTESPMPENTAFLCISRLIRDKGVYEFLEAARRVKKDYKDVRFLLVGPYDSNPSALKKEELEEYIKDGSVEYFGEQKDVRPYIEEASVFILPSYREGTPKTNLEAMAMGRAVITTDAPGCRETVVDGENGYLVAVKDVNALVEKCKVFIEKPELAKEMGIRGRKMAEDTFDVNIVNSKIAEAMEL